MSLLVLRTPTKKVTRIRIRSLGICMVTHRSRGLGGPCVGLWRRLRARALAFAFASALANFRLGLCPCLFLWVGLWLWLRAGCLALRPAKQGFIVVNVRDCALASFFEHRVWVNGLRQSGGLNCPCVDDDAVPKYRRSVNSAMLGKASRAESSCCRLKLVQLSRAQSRNSRISFTVLSMSWSWCGWLWASDKAMVHASMCCSSLWSFLPLSEAFWW